MPAPNLSIFIKMSGGLLPPNTRAGDVEIYDNGRMVIYESDSDIVERIIDRNQILDILQFARQNGFFDLPNIIHDSDAPNVPDVTINLTDSMGSVSVTMKGYQKLRGEMRQGPFDKVYKRVTDLAWQSYTTGQAPAPSPAPAPQSAPMSAPTQQVQQAPVQPNFNLPPQPFGNAPTPIPIPQAPVMPPMPQAPQQPTAAPFELPSLNDLLKSSNTPTPFVDQTTSQEANTPVEMDSIPHLPPLTNSAYLDPISQDKIPHLPPLRSAATVNKSVQNQLNQRQQKNQQNQQPQKQNQNQQAQQNQSSQQNQAQGQNQNQKQNQKQQKPKDERQQQNQVPKQGQGQNNQPAQQKKQEQQPKQVVQPAPKPPVEPPRPEPPKPMTQPPSAPEPEASVPPKPFEIKHHEQPERLPPVERPEPKPEPKPEPAPERRPPVEKRPEPVAPAPKPPAEPPRPEHKPVQVQKPAVEKSSTVAVKKPAIAWEPTQELLNRLEESLKGNLLTFYVADDHCITIEDMRFLYSHLRKLGKKKSLYVLPVIQNGDITVMWRMATLLREFCQELYIIMHDASSVCTSMLSLSADAILMNPFGYLSPIEMKFKHPLIDAGEKEFPLTEVLSAAALAAPTKAKTVKSEEPSPATDQLHPLVITAAKRQYALMRLLCGNLLKLGSMKDKPATEVDKVVTQLTETYPSANYPIAYFEARNMGLSVKETSEEVNDLLWELIRNYMHITKPLVSLQSKYKTVDQQSIIIESIGRRTVFYKESQVDTSNDSLVDEHDRWRDVTMQISMNSQGVETKHLQWKELELVGVTDEDSLHKSS